MNTPHIVKFSGGRSSGMMLMEMLKQRALKPERGDVIVFNNTSAEHPATYRFTREMKNLAEEKYNIPFFWIEYKTFEDAGKHGWKRNPSYRLVNENEYSERNKDGYRFQGEVYEELLSHSTFLPNMRDRSCTKWLKIFTTNAFLADWFAQKEGIDRLGHYGETARITDEDIIHAHKIHKGSNPDEILLAKKEFVRKSDFVRKEALWQDFTKSKICFDNDSIKESVLGNKGELFGRKAISYISCLGIRKDEEIRVEKIRARIHGARNEKGRSLCNQPPRETILAPLVDKSISQSDVIAFWKKQEFNLNLPDSGLFSNCVYCPLKGRAKLLKLAQRELSSESDMGIAPDSIDWWIEMEKKYSRDLKAEKRNVTSEKDVNFIGFFGAEKEPIYRQIKQRAILGASNMTSDIKAEFLEEEDYIPCNCTD